MATNPRKQQLEGSEPTAAPPDSGNEAHALKENNAELQRAAKYRSLMLANIAHDLRTPLTAMLGFAEILLDYEKLTESQRQLCERIQNSGRQLQSTINLLSDLSHLDLEECEISLHEFSLSDALRESCATVSLQAGKKKVVVSYSAEADLSPIVSDESKLRQSLYNFLAYAIERSPTGGQVTATATMAAAGAFLVRIDDEGEAVDVSLGSDLSGLGSPGENPSLQELGLDMSRRLLGVLGGAATLQNREPRGLSIALKLPARTPPR